MYTLIKSLAKERGVGKRWEEVSVGDELVSNVFANYIAFILILNHSVTNETHAVDSRTLPSSTQFFRGTLNEWLVSIGDASLPIMDTVPKLSKRNVVIYKDAFAAGFMAEPTAGTASHTANVLPTDKRWLKLDKAGLNTTTMYRNFMVSINGYFHRIDHDNQSLFVIDGNATRMVSGDANIGLHSYLRVGSIEYRGINSGAIHRVNDVVPLSTKAIVKFDNVIEDGTIGLVIGGILHLLDERVFRVIDPYSIVINFEMIDLKKWFIEANANIDLSSLPVAFIENSDHQIKTETLLTDECIKAILSLSQSFVVVIDAENMYRDRKGVEKTTYSNVYISAQEPIWPLRTNGGRFSEYTYHREDGQFAIHAHMSKATNWIIGTVSESNHPSLGEFVDPYTPETKTDMCFELIGKDL